MIITRREMLGLLVGTGLLAAGCKKSKKDTIFVDTTPPDITASTAKNVYLSGEDISLIVDASDPQTGVKLVGVDWDRDGVYDEEIADPQPTETFTQVGGRTLYTVDTIDVRAENKHGYDDVQSAQLRVLPYQFIDGGTSLDNLIDSTLKDNIIGGKLSPTVWDDYVLDLLDAAAQTEIRAWEDAMNSSTIDQISSVQYAVDALGDVYLFYEMNITDPSAFEIAKFPDNSYIGVMKVSTATGDQIKTIAATDLTPAQMYDVLMESSPSGATYDTAADHAVVLLDQGMANFDLSVYYQLGSQPVDLHFKCPDTAQAAITGFNANYHPPYVPLSAMELDGTNVFQAAKIMGDLLTYHQQNNP